MQRIGWVVGGVLWFALVFFVTWRLTFPSQAVGDRIRLEVHDATAGTYELSMNDLVPWWLGAKASNVVLYENQRGEKSPVFAFERARLRAGLFSLLRREPRVMGAVQIGSAELDYDVTVARGKRGVVPRVVNITADAFPVQDLAGLAGAGIEAIGGLDLEIEIEAGEKGMRDAIGDLKIGGRDILITKLDPELTGGMDLGMEIPVDEVDIHFEIEDGKAEIRTGKIKSSLVDAEIEGEITLREDIARSTMGIEIALELGSELEMFKSFLKSAEWADGSFHYKCSGTVGRPNCRVNPERGGKARAGRSRNNRPSRTGRNRPARGGAAAAGGMSDEDREKRREEALARLRAARERRAADGDEEPIEGEEIDGEEPLEELGYEDDEGEFIDEELPPEELPEDLGPDELAPEGL